MRIYDNPNHPHYGPVRRLWIVLVQLGMADIMDRHTAPRRFENVWDKRLAEMLSIGVDESTAQRTIVRDYLERIKT